ncbi:MAG: hypothetical protein V1889_00800 [archaeon]
MDYIKDFVDAKYHLAVAGRMLASYDEVGDKRFLIGIIREAARATSNLVGAFVKRENSRGDWRNVLLKYVDGATCENLFRILEIERAQRSSPIEYARRDKIILLVDGKYRILTVDRIREFVKSVGDGIKIFDRNFRQI